MNSEQPRWRRLYEQVAPFLALLIMVIALAAGIGTYFNDRANARQDREQIEANTANAVTSCLNANETREAARALWNFVLDLSLAGNEDASDGERAYLEQVRAYMEAVYQERDCNDLSRKYPLPDPPQLPAL